MSRSKRNYPPKYTIRMTEDNYDDMVSDLIDVASEAIERDDIFATSALLGMLQFLVHGSWDFDAV